MDVTVLTAASGEYEKTLKSEMAKSNAPTLFQVNGPVGLASWKDYCYDLKDSDVAKQLTSDDFALMDGDKMSGIAYVIESYGIIYNKELLKKAGYSADDITNFDSFKKVVEDITANKDKLGFSAFTSAGMDGSSDWRFKTHLANLPIYYEYKDEGIDNTDAIKGTYLDNYRQIWDLYINNATCKPTELSTKTADDATADFVTGDAVFYQNGTWEYNNIKDVGDDNLGILPIYIGVEGEEDQGICTGTENYWCVNSKASEDDIQATLDFMNWCVTSDDGVKAMCKDMGFTIPFKKNLKSDNVLVNEANKYTEDGKTPVSWNFSTMPSEEWKNGVGSALTSYAADPTDANWAKVTTAFVDGWAKEAAAAFMKKCREMKRRFSAWKEEFIMEKSIKRYMPIFVLPTFFAFILGFIVPFIMGIWLSFCKFTTVTDAKFVGFSNYIEALKDTAFRHSFWYTVLFAIASLLIINIIAFALAMALTKEMHGTNVFRTVFFMPNLIGGIVLGYIWQLIFNGVLSRYGTALALNEWYGFWGLIILVSWQQIGYMMIIYIAGLQSIPGDIIEAAEIDGANKIQTLFKVTIPMMMPSITICMFLSITNGFKLFDQNLSLTAGEPSKMSEMMALNIFNTFYGRTGWEGVGQAKAVIFFAIVVVIGMIQLRATRSKEVQQ